MGPVTEAPWTFASPWRGRGRVTWLDGAPVHWVEFGTGRGRPPLVFVHGLGGSHLNWALAGPELAGTRRTLALDLRGFGLSPGTRGTATVAANVALLGRFLHEVAGTPAILVGNSMGGLVSILQAHAQPATVAGLVLISPALPSARRRPDPAVGRRFLLYALPGVGEFYLRQLNARMPAREVVGRVIDLCFADPSRADPAMLAAATALAEHRRSMRGGEESLLAAARSLMAVVAQRRRYEAIMASIDAPVLLIGGEADRLVPVASVRRAARLNPRWESRILPGVGHTAQLETPHLVVAAIREWLERHPALTAH